jgi:hypothetical protein
MGMWYLILLEGGYHRKRGEGKQYLQIEFDVQHGFKCIALLTGNVHVGWSHGRGGYNTEISTQQGRDPKKSPRYVATLMGVI